MKTLINQKSDIIASFKTRVTKSTVPKIKHPQIGDVMGIGETIITITEDNQKNFAVSYELSEDEITLLNGGMENKIVLTKSVDDEDKHTSGITDPGQRIDETLLLEVVNAELNNNYLTISIQQSINIYDGNLAIELFESKLKGYELNCVEFRDNNTNNIYYLEVDSIHKDEMEFDVVY